MNQVKLIGNIGKDAEIRMVKDRAVVRFPLVTNEKYQNKQNETVENATWHSVVAWGKMAEQCKGLLVKGRFVAIEGKLNHRSYLNKEKEMVYVTEIVALNVSDYKK